MDSAASIKSLRNILNHKIFIQDDLDLYERYIIQIETNKFKEPNVAFEAAKSLGEAIFRHVLKHKRVKVEFADVLTRSTPSTYDLFKATCRALADLGVMDIELFGLGQKFFNDMSQIRNSIGIISHGKDLRDVSNLRSSTVELSIANTINHILVILVAYEELLGEPVMDYEDNIDFNEYLDSEHNLQGVVYSRALYDQDTVLYGEMLDEYEASEEPEEV